jgi:signal transduction histidine kinase/CheY-like chemotaxis protein
MLSEQKHFHSAADGPEGNPEPREGAKDQIIKNLQKENEELRKKLTLLAEAADANRARDPFLAALSHELRDPLAPIRTSVALMNRAGSGDPVIRQAKEIIDRQVNHLTRLVDDLLDASHLAQGRMTVARENLDLKALAAAVAEDHRGALEAAGVRLDLALPAGPVRVAGDPARLAQVIDRLLENAARYTDRGGRVELSLAVQESGPAVLAVEDTGIGLEPGDLGLLFEPFYRAGAGADRSAGLGLGLALVKDLVDLHGGTVSAHSDGPGRGARFTVRLPLAEGRDPAAPGPAVAARPLRILIVEDLSDAAITLELLLEMLGHTVEAAAEGQAGLDKARWFHPEVVICDIGLPGHLDGYDVARTMRATPGLEGLYLIALTGFNSQEDKDKARQAGFDLHLTKPADPVALERLLAALPEQPVRFRS